MFFKFFITKKQVNFIVNFIDDAHKQLLIFNIIKTLFHLSLAKNKIHIVNNEKSFS